MERKETNIDIAAFPEVFHPFLKDRPVFDSSCSPQARVWYLPKDGGLYLKTAPKGSLRREADMTSFLHGKGLAAEVLTYENMEKDWLLTRAVPGEDCTFARYLEDPERLSVILGQRLRFLHELSAEGCPITDHSARYLQTAEENYRKGLFDPFYFPEEDITAEMAWRIVQQAAPELKSEVILHGDYCLPNVMLDDWRFSGFIDLDHGGIGDRHIDLYWGCWSLGFNLKTDRYRDRFLDAYGRDKINEALLSVIGAFEVFG